MHRVKHSQGLVVVEASTAYEMDWSFVIDRKGKIHEQLGWQHADRFPEIVWNGPPSEHTVLTVHVEEINDPTLRALRELIDQHQVRFGGCMVWLAGADRDLRNWVAGGCRPIDKPEADVGTGETADEEPEDGDEPESEDDAPMAKPDTVDRDLQAKLRSGGIPGVTQRQVAPERPKRQPQTGSQVASKPKKKG